MQIAERLRGGLAEQDLAGRFGGDEFAVLLAGPVDRLAAGRLAGRLVRSLAEPILLGAGPVVVSVSIGMAVPDGTADHQALLRQADRALYAAKDAGKGCWRMFDPEPAPAAARLPLPRAVAEAPPRADAEAPVLS